MIKKSNEYLLIKRSIEFLHIQKSNSDLQIDSITDPIYESPACKKHQPEIKLHIFPEIEINNYKSFIAPHLNNNKSIDFSINSFLDNIKEEYKNICIETPFVTGNLTFGEKKDRFPTSCTFQNWQKNRYGDILCTENSRVIIKKQKFLELSSSHICISFETTFQQSYEKTYEEIYINANFIQADPSTEIYIATQAPIPCSMPDFFEMVWSQNTRIIVVLTAVCEGGRKKMDEYWSNKNPLTFGNYIVEIQNEKIEDELIIRKFLIKNLCTDQTREITQLHYQKWPDKGIPPPESCIKLYLKMRELQKNRNNNEKTIIHCSAGIGRTAVFAAISAGIEKIDQLYKKYGNNISRDLLNNEINLTKFIIELRKQRDGSVQTWEQYCFIYDSLNMYIAHYLK